jgi:hypothetical protein
LRYTPTLASRRPPACPAPPPACLGKAVNEDGWSALHLAARAGAAEKVKLLLEAGADAGLETKQGHTPLALVRARVVGRRRAGGWGLPAEAAYMRGRDLGRHPPLPACPSPLAPHRPPPQGGRKASNRLL